MDKPPIDIPDYWKPDSTVTLGYSGGMALYVSDFHAMMYLFELTNVAFLAYTTVTTYKLLN